MQLRKRHDKAPHGGANLIPNVEALPLAHGEREPKDSFWLSFPFQVVLGAVGSC